MGHSRNTERQGTRENLRLAGVSNTFKGVSNTKGRVLHAFLVSNTIRGVSNTLWGVSTTRWGVSNTL